ncbi:MAG: protein-glutamate O-methyltransferase CheR [Nitrospiraceae bacterium]|nr:protein-glutamate O-methyltransferase CheR [Nitrospiraceae bacterium]
MTDGNTAKKLNDASASMAPDTFKQLRDLIYEHTGIYFQESKKYLLESRLQPRLKECRCRSYEDYLNFLRFDAYRDREFTGLFTVITTNETYFFRDEAQLETFMKVIVPALMKVNEASRQIRLWSAACSTGDEAYTLAILLKDYPPLANWTIDILASDISESVLEVGRKGVYSSHSLRKVPPGLLAKYFSGPKEEQCLAPHVKSVVKFMNVNLYDRPRLKLIRGIDVIFCRNCLIYFDDKAKTQIVTDLRDALRPKGFLVIGFSEALPDKGGAFKPIHSGRAVVYEKQ